MGKGRPAGQLTLLRRLVKEVDDLAVQHGHDVRNVLHSARRAGKWVEAIAPLSAVEAADVAIRCPVCAFSVLQPAQLLRAAVLEKFSRHGQEVRRHAAEAMGGGHG